MDKEAEVVKAASQLSAAVESNNVENLSTCDLRVFIDCCRNGTSVPLEILQKASKDLLLLISGHSISNDSKIVGATAYSSIMTYLLQDPSKIFEHYLHLLKQEEEEGDYKIYLCHVILQMNNSYWTNQCEMTQIMLDEIFKIVHNLCCCLKSTSFFAFKVFYSLLCKIHMIYPNTMGVSTESFKIMLNIVMSNWENPLGGVRQQNSLILGQLLLFDDEIWNSVLPDSAGCVHKKGKFRHQRLLELIFTHLSWTMKTKYFILAAVLPKTDILEVLKAHKEDLIPGLMLSLSVPHLVPAGTDLYRAILGELSHTEWHHYFLTPLSHILTNPGVSLENENLFNYWMLPTIKRVPSALDDLFEVTSINIYSFISLLRIKRKEGFPGSSWEEMNKCKIKFALEDYSDKIRSQAFSLICTSSKASISPKIEEFDLVKQYLRQNINSDSTVLRQSLLNSFTNFIIHLRDMLLHLVKSKNTEALSRTLCFEFLDWLHSFLLYNLKIKCNYQRKYTSLELYMIVLMYFGDPVRRKEQSYSRKSNKNSLSLRSEKNPFAWSYKFESLSSQKALLDCLFDGDNDVRLSAGTILTTHFKISESFAEEFEHFFKKGLSLCSSSIFYKAESGARIVQVLVILASNCTSEMIKKIVYKGNAFFLNALLSSAEEQFRLLKEDLLKAASQGSFLYGTLQTLTLLLTDPESPEFMLLDANQVERLLHLMEENTQFFLSVLSSKSDPTSEYAPSFGEMGMAIAAVVERSSLKDEEVTVEMGDDTSADLQLTPAQQLVLSCIWLNLKESSVLCSKLVSKPLTVRDTERCVTVVVSVLRRCRHKGAIESAGLALYHIAKYITSSPIPELQALPSQLMEWCLTSLVGNTATTVSRRSAGLAILVHRLITGDSRHTKPLLHNCVARLLVIATDSHVVEGELLVDLPQSQALHFLRTLVQEASLREHMAQYMLRVSLVALSNLSSPIWTIRNAALQLIGAIVPKLVGQKPHQEEGRGNHHLAFEELYFHAKPLVKVMLNEFSEAGKLNSMNAHSKLMPLLTLVTNLVAGVQSIIAEDVLEIVQMFRNSFILLFKSCIFNVRKLSAKAHSMFLTSSELVPTINERVQQILGFLDGEESCNWSENELHGCLLNVTYLVQRFNDEKAGICLLELQEEKVKLLLNNLAKSVLRGQHTYFVKSLVFELNCSVNVINFSNISDTNTSKISLGLPHFISKHISNQMLVMHNGCDVIEQIKQWLVECQNEDIHLSCLKVLPVLISCKSIHKDWVITDSVTQLVIILKDFIMQKRLNTELLVLSLDIMLHCLELLSENHLGQYLFCPEFNLYCHNILDSNMTPAPVFQLLLPVVCGILSFEKTVDMELVEKGAALINKISDPHFDYDQDRRVYAAKSMLFFIKILKSEAPNENQCGSLIWKACVHFLQDEVTDVRYEASRFVTSFMSVQKDKVWNPYVSLETVFSSSFMTALMPHKQVLVCLLDQMEYDCNSKHSVNGVTNPFDHGVNSIYEEKVVVAHLASCSIIEIAKTCDNLDRLKIKERFDSLNVDCKYLPNVCSENRKCFDFVEKSLE